MLKGELVGLIVFLFLGLAILASGIERISEAVAAAARGFGNRCIRFLIGYPFFSRSFWQEYCFRCFSWESFARSRVAGWQPRRLRRLCE